jgi:hypothetical protein
MKIQTLEFAEERPDLEFVQQALAQLPWGQNPLLLTRRKTREARLWTWPA